jgi:hypothetical protein
MRLIGDGKSLATEVVLFGKLGRNKVFAPRKETTF